MSEGNNKREIFYGYFEDTPPFDKAQILQMVGPGWSSIVNRLIDDLFDLGWDGRIHQVKEKFGGLRFYIGGGTDAIFARISQAEEESYKTCEDCGEPGKIRDGGWWRTLCDGCQEKRYDKPLFDDEKY